MWHHAVSQCRGIEDVETGKKHCVDPTARYPSKFHFDHLTKIILCIFQGHGYRRNRNDLKATVSLSSSDNIEIKQRVELVRGYERK